MGKSAGSAPGAPDPNIVAAAQGQANIDAARTNASLNRVNTFTPLGSTVYTNAGEQEVNRLLSERNAARLRGEYTPNYGTNEYGARILEPWREDIERKNIIDGLGGGADRWTSETTFSPETQQVFGALLSRAGDRTTTENALFGRLNPSLEAQRQGLETRLSNQGLTPGSEAWTRAMQAQGMAENDARLAVTAASGQEQMAAVNALLGLGGGAGGGSSPGTAGVTPVDWQSLYGNQQAGQNAQYQAKAANAASGNAAAAGIASAAIAAAAIA